MRWSDRQQAMLREIGLTLWQPASANAAAAAVDAQMADLAPMAELVRAVEPPLSQANRPVTAPSPPTATTTAQPVALAPDSTARNAAIAAMQWPMLRAAVAECTACGLCQSRRQTVFGIGHEHAHWMIVGEAPGEQEDLAGEPFVGAAGRLLDRMLLALGLTREASDSQRQVYIANSLKCRPPHNRNPQPQELAQCLPFLERQVALIQPKLILAMGRFAVQSLLGSSEPIGRLRGKVHHWRGVAVVVTYHPAYLLRQPTEKARAWADLCLAAQTLQQALQQALGD